MVKLLKIVSVVRLLVLVFLLVITPSLVSVALAKKIAPIKIGTIKFTPKLGEEPNIPSNLKITEYKQGIRGHYLVQFQGPIIQSWKDQVFETGAELLSYVPDFAFKVRMTPGQARKVKKLDSVEWVGFFHPAYKFSRKLKRDGMQLYTIRIERGAEVARIVDEVTSRGARVFRKEGNILHVAADSALIDTLAHMLDIAWIENFMFREKHNEYAGGIILGANSANDNNYNGSTQTVAVADTGLGDGTISGAHPNIPATRITAIQNWSAADSFLCYDVVPDGAQDVDSGHGTHVAVSVLGDGDSSGTAPEANLFFQAVEEYVDLYGFCGGVDGYYLIGLPNDLGNLFQNAYSYGARIHSNSWGSNVAGDYTLDSANTDAFIWNNPDMTITFSAGNAGTDANRDGVVDNNSIGSPATAKNVISVGASENDRGVDYPCDTSLIYTPHDPYQSFLTCGYIGGNQADYLGTYGQRYPNDFPNEPLESDVTAGNQEQMAAWSSRGPTDDGRIKPDVVAPGTWILSGYSGLYQEGFADPEEVNPLNGLFQWDGWGMPYNESYKYMGGTSMANPLVAGGAAVVRDYYQKAHGQSASAALVKATLINSAVDMLDENNDGVNDNDFPIPNIHEGWGRVNLANATDGSHQFIDEATGLSSNVTSEYHYSVTSNEEHFKATLVWSDYPSTESAFTNLVNDLDLTVTSPSGDVYYGNVFSNGWSQTGGSPDRINNVECVYVNVPEIGTWTIEVRGQNVPQGPQPYALVVDGVSGGENSPPNVNINNPADGSTVSGTVTIQIAATDADPDDMLDVEWNVDNGEWQPATYNEITGYYEASWDSTTVSDGNHTIGARASDNDGNIRIDENSVFVDNLNNLPAASFTYICNGLTCNFNASGSSDSDGTIVNYNWIFGDGSNTGSGVSISHTYTTSDTYDVILTVTDNDGDIGTNTQTVIVTDIPSMHIGDIDAKSRIRRSIWRAIVTITVHNQEENPLADAIVSGTFSDGTSVFQCTTGGNGKCNVTGYQLTSYPCLTFTIDDVTHSGLTYDSSNNHDPENDSNSTSIEVCIN